jgi:hypothetical protein
MLISSCVLGYGDTAKEFVSRFKSLPYYKKRDSDTEGVRVHTVYVNDESLLDKEYVYRYKKNNNFSNVLNDGDQETKREVSVGNDSKWLLGSDGHNMIFEAVDGAKGYFDTLLALIRRGYWTILTSTYEDWQMKSIKAAADEGNALVVYAEDIDEVFEQIDSDYQARLKQHRENLYKESLEATPCGLN